MTTIIHTAKMWNDNFYLNKHKSQLIYSAHINY